MYLNFLIPSLQCGAVIGKGGTKIKKIKKTMGATINVLCELLPDSSERNIKIIGNRENVRKCIYHTCCTLLENPLKEKPKLYRPTADFLDEVKEPMMMLEDLGNEERDDEGRGTPPRRLVSDSGTNSGNPSNASANLAQQNEEDRDQDYGKMEDLQSKVAPVDKMSNLCAGGGATNIVPNV